MKVLFIGLGSIGQRHLRNLLTIRKDLQIFAYRTSMSVPLLSENNEVIQENTQKDFFNITEFNCLEDSLNIEPNMIFICNPTSMHIETLLKVIKSKAYIFIEKPLSHNSKNIKEIILNEANEGNNRIYVGYQFRFHPCIIEAKKIIDKGLLGNIINASFFHGEYLPDWHKYEDYRNSYAAKEDLGGGALLTLIHEFDMILNFFSIPRKLFAIGGHLSQLDLDVEDSVQVLMECEKYKKNFPVNVSLDYLNWPPKKEFIINGDLGNITCDLIKNKFIFNKRKTREIIINNYSEFERNDMFISQIKHFFELSESKTIPKIDLRTAFNSLKIALAAKRSLKTGNVEYL